MPYGYLGQNQPNQTVSNSGVFSITDVAELQSLGKLGGSLELIEEQTVASASVLDFTSIQGSKFDVHKIEYNLEPSNYSALYLRYYESGVLETASVYQYAQQFGATNGSFSRLASASQSFIQLNYSSQYHYVGYIYLYNLNNSNKFSTSTHHTFSDDTGNSRFFFTYGGGLLPQSSTVDGIRLYPSSNTFTGTAKIYGVKQI